MAGDSEVTRDNSDPVENTVEDLVRDIERDRKRDFERDFLRDTARDKVRDKKRDASRDTKRDAARDMERDRVRDQERDRVRDQERDKVRDKERDTAEEAVETGDSDREESTPELTVEKVLAVFKRITSVNTPEINSQLAIPFKKQEVQDSSKFKEEYSEAKADLRKTTGGKGKGAYQEEKKRKLSLPFPWPKDSPNSEGWCLYNIIL